MTLSLIKKEAQEKEVKRHATPKQNAINFIAKLIAP